jgi:tetratricopeptide (TPR) repeat protein/TolB-like protein
MDEENPTVPDAPRRKGTESVQLPSRFVVKRQLGEGGMGSVVEAYDDVLSRDVAIKILARDQRRDPNVGARFLREARAAAQLRHPGIVQVHDIDPAGGYIVMELVRGESLSARLWREHKLPIDEVRRIGRAIAKALAVAHAAGIVHRDVKPANVLLGESGEVKLADFGVAYFGDSDLTMPGTRVGTPAYMAPEQLRGKDIDARVDVYAAGVTLFEAIVGERPKDDKDFDAYGHLVTLTGDTAFAAAIARAIRDRPSERFASGAELAEALDATATPDAPAAAQPRKRRLPLVALTLGLAAVGGASYWYFHRAPSASGHRTIALLPFVDRTHDPMLDFAAAGMPNLLGLELHGMPDITVIGYYRMLGITGPNAPREAWLAAARQLGAEIVVQGEISETGTTAHVALAIDTIDGAHVDALELEARVEDVPDVVRRSAGRVVEAALGRRIDVASSAPSSFAADRELQLGIAALDRERLVEAGDHLRAAIHHAPGSALAHYYYAIELAWSSPPSEPVHEEVAKALATGGLDDAQRGMLAGVEKMADLDYVAGIDVLRPLAEKYGDDRELLYVLFECLFHGGRPAEAMSVYRRINQLAPKFRLALVHVFTFYISHGDDAGMNWALSLNDATGDTYSPIWEPRVLMARREYDHAIELLSSMIANAKGDTGTLQIHLITCYALSGQLDLATALANKLNEERPGGVSQELLGLAALRGDEATRKKLVEAALREDALAPVGPIRAMPVNLLAGAQLMVASHVELEAIDKMLDGSVVPNYERSLNLQLAQVLLAEALDHPQRIEQLARSNVPEISELAHAALSRRAGDRAAAATAMRRSIAATGDARFLADQWWLLAGDLRATGDHAGVVAACDEVLRPRLALSWAWASAAGYCLAWTAEADEALGKRDDARVAWTRLLATRTAAPADDRLVAAARAALAKAGR